jgi:hypothetical protein
VYTARSFFRDIISPSVVKPSQEHSAFISNGISATVLLPSATIFKGLKLVAAQNLVLV